MNQEITKIIDQYLTNELSTADRAAFESRLKSNPKLQAEVDLQKTVIAGAKRAGQRVKVEQFKKSYHFKKLIKKAVISTIAVAVLAVATLMILNYLSNKIIPISDELKEQLDEMAQIDDLYIQYFQVPEEGSVVLSEDGVLISVPQDAFMKDGKPYRGKTIVQLQEALSGEDIIKSGLNTMSGDRLLETQGMLGITGFTPDGEELTINPKVGVYVQVPVDDYEDGMQLFKGEKDANGEIDWQNPTALAKIPVPVDMDELDFYPEQYEPYLDDQKWNKSKKSRDSLYLSFDDWGSREQQYGLSYEDPRFAEGRNLFYAKCATCHEADWDRTGPKLRNARSKWENGGAKPGSINLWVQNWEYAVERDPYAAQVANSRPTAMDKFPELSVAEINQIFDYVDASPYDETALEEDGDTIEENYWELYGDQAVSRAAKDGTAEMATDTQGNPYVTPSKVLGFWNKKFNNTNLSTRAFETRMRAIHNTCSDDVLKKYTGQLGKSISAIDKQVVAMGYPEFERFASENLGVVNANNPHLKNLQEFYDKSIAQLKDKSKRARKKKLSEQEAWDKDTKKSREKEKERTVYRETQALLEEYEFNMESVKKQIGPSVGFTLGHSPTGTIVNVDKYVMDATIARKTTTITDPFSGKTAEIIYNDFSFEVPNQDKYIKLFAYLFPHQMSSYQRLESDKGTFSYPLNDGMIYDIGIVGLTEDGYEYFQKQTFNSGNLGAIEMSRVTESQLEESIRQLNGKRISKPMRIKEELQWLVRERKDYKEQKQRKDMEKFRYEVSQSLFPCLRMRLEDTSSCRMN